MMKQQFKKHAASGGSSMRPDTSRSLKRKHEKETNDKEDISADIFQLQAENNRLTFALKKVQTDLQNFRTEADRKVVGLEKELNKWKDRAVKLKLHKVEMQRKKDSIKKPCEDCVALKLQVNITLENVQRLQNESQAQMENSQKEKDKLTEENQKLTRKLEDWRETKYNLNNELKKKGIQCQELENYSNSLQNKLDITDKLLRQSECRVAGLEKQVSHLTERVTKADAETMRNRRIIRKHHDEIIDWTQQLDSSQSQLADVKRLYSSMQEQRDKLKSQLDETIRVNKTQIDSLTKRLALAKDMPQKQEESEKAQIEQQKQKTLIKESVIKQAQIKKTRKEARIEELKQNVNKLELNVQRLKRDVSRSQELDEERDWVRKQLILLEENNTGEVNVREIEEKVQELGQEVKILRMMFGDGTVGMAKCRQCESKLPLRQTLEKKEREIERLKHVVACVPEDMVQKLHCYQADNRLLKKKLNGAEGTISAYTEKCKKLTVTNEIIKSELSSLQMDLRFNSMYPTLPPIKSYEDE